MRIAALALSAVLLAAAAAPAPALAQGASARIAEQRERSELNLMAAMSLEAEDGFVRDWPAFAAAVARAAREDGSDLDPSDTMNLELAKKLATLQATAKSAEEAMAAFGAGWPQILKYDPAALARWSSVPKGARAAAKEAGAASRLAKLDAQAAKLEAAFAKAIGGAPMMRCEFSAGITICFIRTVQQRFRTADLDGDGVKRYARTLAELAGASTLVNREVAAGKFRGYAFAMAATDDRFEVTARPLEYGKTGRESFYADSTGIVTYTDDGAAPNAKSESAEEFVRLIDHTTIIIALQVLAALQEEFRASDPDKDGRDYAASFDELEKAGLVEDKALFASAYGGGPYLLRVQKVGAGWLGQATPQDPTTHQGVQIDQTRVVKPFTPNLARPPQRPPGGGRKGGRRPPGEPRPQPPAPPASPPQDDSPHGDGGGNGGE